MQKTIDGTKWKMCHWLLYDEVTLNSILQGQLIKGLKIHEFPAEKNIHWVE